MYVVYFYGATIRCDNYTPRSEQRYSIIAGWNTEERPNAAPFSADVRTPATAIARWYEPATNAFKKCDINAIKPLNEDMGELLLGGPELSFPSNLIGPPLASNITSIGNDSGGGPGQGVALGSVQPNQWIVWPEPGSGGWSGSSGTDSGWQTGHPFVAWSIPRN